MGLTGDPINLLIKLVLKRKVSIMQTELQQFYDVLNQ